jgi:hypothetical protein
MSFRGTFSIDGKFEKKFPLRKAEYLPFNPFNFNLFLLKGSLKRKGFLILVLLPLKNSNCAFFENEF